MNRVRQLSAAGLLGIVMIFELAAFALLSLRDESFDYKALIFAGGLIVVLLLQYIIILWISKYADRFFSAKPSPNGPANAPAPVTHIIKKQTKLFRSIFIIRHSLYKCFSLKFIGGNVAAIESYNSG